MTNIPTDPDGAAREPAAASRETDDRPVVTPLRVLLWSTPVLASFAVLAATFALNWEPWFGYASVIAGALGSLMLVGEAFGQKGG